MAHTVSTFDASSPAGRVVPDAQLLQILLATNWFSEQNVVAHTVSTLLDASSPAGRVVPDAQLLQMLLATNWFTSQ